MRKTPESMEANSGECFVEIDPAADVVCSIQPFLIKTTGILIDQKARHKKESDDEQREKGSIFTPVHNKAGRHLNDFT